MAKELIKKWREYFKKKLNSGYSFSQIKEEFLKVGYQPETIDTLIRDYKKSVATKKRSNVVSVFFLIMIFLFSWFFIRPEDTGKVVSIIGAGTGETYYVDSINGNNNNNGLSTGSPFQTLSYALTFLNDGDILYVMAGNYTTTTSFDFSNKNLNSAVIIAGYPGTRPLVKANIQGFEHPSANTWTNISNKTLNMWTSSYTTSEPTFIAYYKDSNQSLFSYNTYSQIFNTSKPEGVYYNSSNSKLIVRFSDMSKNPNLLSLIISNNNILNINNVKGNGIIVANLSFEGGIKCIYVTNSNNMIIENVVCHSALKGIDVRSSSNTTITKSEIFMVPGNFSWKDMKLSLMETSALYLQDDYDDLNITSNIVYGYFNGILTYSTSIGKFLNAEVTSNRVFDIYDDAIEIEDFCNGADYHHNNISDVFVGFSLSPAQAEEKRCHIYNNLIITNKSVRWDNSGTYFAGECFKIIDNLPAGYMDYTKNTCIGRGVYTTSGSSNSQKESTWKDNIFYSKNQKLLEKSGLSSQGVFYDYNLYYREDAGAIFQYWNSDSDTTQFSSLIAATSSSLWNGNWDLHSRNIDPLFIDVVRANFKPIESSPACTMSSIGSYVGAIPCVVEVTVNVTVNTTNSTNQTIPNNPPTLEMPMLIASDYPKNTTNASLLCLNQSSDDLDGDSITFIYHWFKNLALAPEFNNINNISSDNTQVNDTWTCQITPFDGIDYGLPINSTTILIFPDTTEITLNETNSTNQTAPNNPPTLEMPMLIASDYPSNTTNASLLCLNQSFQDLDGDPILFIYHWFKNLVLTPEFNNINNISSDNTQVNDTWTCQITPFDGIDYGLPINSTAILIFPDTTPEIILNETNSTNSSETQATAPGRSGGGGGGGSSGGSSVQQPTQDKPVNKTINAKDIELSQDNADENSNEPISKNEDVNANTEHPEPLTKEEETLLAYLTPLFASLSLIAFVLYFLLKKY